MIVLGINDNHDASAAVCVGGELRAAVGQERLDRQKNSGAFPWEAISSVLHLAGVTPRDVDRVVFGSHFTPATVLRRFPTLHHGAKDGGQYSPLFDAYILYQVAARVSGAWTLEADLSRRLLHERLRARGISAPVHTMEHHGAHAYSAYRSQRHADALALTLDSMGDGTTATVSLGVHGDLKPIWRQNGLASINTYYSRITEWLGFKANRHEGKITGLAAYAEPPPELLAHFARQMRCVGPGFNVDSHLVPSRKDDEFHRVLARFRKEEVAAALQRNLEEQVCRWVQHWIRATGRRHLALAGGIFANVKLNQRIHELPGVGDIFVYPNMGDGGLAAGAALAHSAVIPHELGNVYLGEDIEEGACEAALRDAGLSFTRPQDLTGELVDVLEKGLVVARCAGRMEWGPRALGNRSVLVRPDDPSVNDWLNRRFQRTEFMPFAPVTLWEERDRCYRNVAGAEHAARFMTVCFDCTDEMRRQSPGVVHKDGTARPQLLRREDNPPYYDLLSRWHQRTGNPSLINTSFNMHEEPIVRGPRDAVRAFLDGRLDVLQLGPFVARRAA
jgi:carbamoyltransferase